MRKTLVSSVTRIAAAALAVACCVGFAGCGSGSSSDSSSDSSSSSASSTKMNQIAGITATGELGKKPTIHMKTPMTVENNSYAILQKGNGATIEDGNRVCAQGIAINAKDGTELMNTWEKNTPDCSIVVSSNSSVMRPDYYQIMHNAKINTTIAFGVNDQSSSGVSYVMVLTLVSQSKDLNQAEGTKVENIPSDLPKVTVAKNGKPSIDMNGYKGSDKLVVQPLIKGDGAKLTSTDTAVVKYTGWLLDGKQFDSSWEKNTTFDANLSGGVIKGWTEGLTGQTVGSQVLLVIPPDLGYGNTAQGSIPANSTLVFVVDILAKY